jgi:hypothetical protein
MSSRSICAEKLQQLLNAIDIDYHNWDGFAEPLAKTFQHEKIDPMVRYSKHYSWKKPFMVVSYSWECTSLRKIADILGEEDIFGNQVHKGKTVWIDVLCTRQFAEVPVPNNTALPVDAIATLYHAAFEHLVVPSRTFFRRAQCLLDLVITSSAGDIQITVVGNEADLDWARFVPKAGSTAGRPAPDGWQNSKSNASTLIRSTGSSKLDMDVCPPESESTGFYACMEASHKAELDELRALATRLFASPTAFDDAVRAAIGGLRAAILFRRANQLDFPIPTAHDGDDAAAARAVLEKAAARGHADAACLLGRYHELGRGGLTADAAAAARLYRQAADGGSARGRFCLALALRRGDGGLPRDAAAAARMYSLAEDGLGSWVAGDDRPAAVRWAADLLGVWTWERQGAVWPVEAARRETARIARLGAARRAAPAPAEQVAMAVAGGPAWEEFAAAVAAAGDEAGREAEAAMGGGGCGRCAVS